MYEYTAATQARLPALEGGFGGKVARHISSISSKSTSTLRQACGPTESRTRCSLYCFQREAPLAVRLRLAAITRSVWPSVRSSRFSALPGEPLFCASHQWIPPPRRVEGAVG